MKGKNQRYASPQEARAQGHRVVFDVELARQTIRREQPVEASAVLEDDDGSIGAVIYERGTHYDPPELESDGVMVPALVLEWGGNSLPSSSPCWRVE